MRIAFFAQYYHTAGTYFRWHNLAIGLKQLGHEVDVYTGDHNWKSSVRHEVKDEIDYFITPSLQTSRIFYNPNDPFSSIRRLFFLPKKKYDVYHLFQPFLSAYTPWKFLQKKIKDAAFIFDWDDLWTDGLFESSSTSIRDKYLKKVTACLEKRIPNTSDGVTVCSNFLAQRVSGNIPIEIIGNGFWPKPVPSKVEMRKKWKLENDIFYAAYIGKTAGELDWIVNGLKYIPNPDVKLVIVGPPKDQVESLFLGNENRIIYLGEVSATDAREIAAAVDLGLIPLENSLFNQSRFPIKFFDFLTVGTPIYISDVGEIAKIGKEMNEVILGSDQKLQWMEGLKTAIIKANLFVSYDNSLQHLINNYSWKLLALKQVDFYNKVIGNMKSIHE